MYIDFDFYKTNGGTITDEATFDRLNRQASIYVEYLTLGNIKKYETEEIPEAVKLCIVDVISEIDDSEKMIQQYGVSGVKAISNNGISITMDTSLVEQLKSNIADIVKMQLANVYTPDGFSILFRGVI